MENIERNIETETANIQVLEKGTVAIFKEPDRLELVLRSIGEQARNVPKTVELAKDRKVIASFAANIAKSKVYLDNLGKEYVSDLKHQAGKIDKIRRNIRTRLDDLKEEVRKPLTEWEQKIRDRISDFTAGVDLQTANIANLEEYMQYLNSIVIDSSFDKYAQQAKEAKATAIVNANAAIVNTKIALKIAEEAKAKQQQEIKDAEERVKKEAEEKIKAEAERRAFAETRAKKLEADAEKAAKLAEFVKRKAVELAKKQEQEKIEAKLQAKKNAEKERAANFEHVTQVNRGALVALMDVLKMDKKQAKAVIVAIVQEKIPNVTINY